VWFGREYGLDFIFFSAILLELSLRLFSWRSRKENLFNRKTGVPPHQVNHAATAILKGHELVGRWWLSSQHTDWL
jgi:hypothetical protein